MSDSSSDDISGGFELWHFNPSIPAGAVAVVIFAVLTGLHTWRLVKSRTWFCIPFVVGGLFEFIGYAARLASHNNRDALTPYIIQSLLLLLAPILFAASIYMILGRIVRATNGIKHSIIRVNWITKIFVTGDVLCFCIQGGGGGILSRAESAADYNLGQNVILGGLILQIVIFLLFIAVASVFHLRLRKNPTVESRDSKLPWERLMLFLYSTSVLITVRNLFRVIEYAMGNDGYLLQKEWPLYIFDGLLMALVLVICLMWYIDSIKKRDVKSRHHQMESLDSGERVEVRPKYQV